MAEELKKRYNEHVVPALQKQFGYRNVMQIPKLTKVVVNIGVGDAKEDAKFMDAAVADLQTITGQKPSIRKSKKSIASFKLRQGQNIGAMVTLRGNRMYDFVERLLHAAIPRVRDFQGLSPNSFDGRGNYTLGLKEQLIFPEINADKVVKIRGMDITFVTTAKTDEEARSFLAGLGFPFRTGAASQ